MTEKINPLEASFPMDRDLLNESIRRNLDRAKASDNEIAAEIAAELESGRMSSHDILMSSAYSEHLGAALAAGMSAYQEMDDAERSELDQMSVAELLGNLGSGEDIDSGAAGSRETESGDAATITADAWEEELWMIRPRGS